MKKSKWEREWEHEYRARDRQLEKIAPWIGYLVMAFNELEERLNDILIEVTFNRNDIIGNIVFGGMSFSSKCEMLGKVVRSWFGASGTKQSIQDKFEKLLSALKEANQRRNDSIHAAWENYDVQSKSVKTKTKVNVNKCELNHITKKILPRDLKRDISFLYRVYEHLKDFFEDGYAERWTEKRPKSGYINRQTHKARRELEALIQKKEKLKSISLEN